MKRRIILLATTVFLYNLSYGQVTKESYEEAVDILNYQSVYYSLAVISPTIGVKQSFLTKCNCENSPAYEKIKSSIPETEKKTIEISSEVQKLKNKDISAFNKSRALDFLLKNSFDKSKALTDFKGQLKQKGKLSDYTEKTIQKLGAVLRLTSNQKESDSKLSNFDDRIRTLEKNLNSKEAKSGILGGLSDYLILLAIILSILGLFLALRKNDNYGELLPKIIDSKRLKAFVQKQISFNRNAQENSSNTSEIRDLHNRIRDLETQIGTLNQNHKLTQPAPIQTTSGSDQEVSQPEPKIETLFLSTPNSDGSFNESSASNTYRGGASIYRLTKTGTFHAKFEIDEKETSIKLALQYPDKNIDPVCDAENAFNPKSTRISTKKMGEAELQNGKWIINSKAVIRYED